MKMIAASLSRAGAMTGLSTIRTTKDRAGDTSPAVRDASRGGLIFGSCPESFALSVWLSATLTVAISAAFTRCAPNSAPDAVTAPRVVGVDLVAARLSAGSKSSETREVAGVFIGNNRYHKRESQNGGHQQFPVAPEYEVLSWIAHLAFLFTVAPTNLSR
jgi:hypothetical protein